MNGKDHRNEMRNEVIYTEWITFETKNMKIEVTADLRSRLLSFRVTNTPGLTHAAIERYVACTTILFRCTSNARSIPIYAAIQFLKNSSAQKKLDSICPLQLAWIGLSALRLMCQRQQASGPWVNGWWNLQSPLLTEFQKAAKRCG